MNKAVFRKIDDEILRLLNEYEEEDMESKFLDMFLEENSFNNINGVMNLSPQDILIAFVCSNSNVITYDEIKKFAQDNKRLLLGSSYYEYYKLFKILFTFKLMDPRNIEKLNEKQKQQYETMQVSVKFIEKQYDVDTKEIMAMLDKDQDAFGEANALVCSIKRAQEEVREIENYVKKHGLENDSKYELKDLMSAYSTIKDYYTNKEKSRKRKNNKIQKQIDNLQDLKPLLRKEMEKEEISSISKILNLVENPELKKEVIKTIYEHNKDVYEETEKKYEKLAGDHKNKIKKILDKYNIKYDVNKINKDIEIDDLKFILEIISKYDFESIEELVYIINNTNTEIVDSINKLYINGCITLDFIKNNLSIFNKNFKSSTYPILIKNIKIIKDHELNPRMFSKTPEVLLTDNEIFSNNIKVLEDYKLKGKLKKTNSYRFLALDDLDIKLDKILELGFEEFLKKDLYLLNYSYNSWDKVFIMKEIGEVPETIEELKEVLKDNSYISDSELSDYMMKNNEIEDEEINVDTLEKYDNTTRTYNINGVLISKNKVKRYQKDNKIKISEVIKDSLILKEEQQIIYDALKYNVNGFDIITGNMI
ncbi:MAG: hypothetical protein E7160_00565 [Firmicutes bacterium]|nr:hypothetical protein [Bacillota bacterium]